MVPQTHSEQEYVTCQEAITNPICKHCLEKQMVSWLADKNENIVVIPRKNTFSPTRIKCILCNKWMKIYPHCYSKEVSSEDNLLADTFVDAFNFELK